MLLCRLFNRTITNSYYKIFLRLFAIGGWISLPFIGAALGSLLLLQDVALVELDGLSVVLFRVEVHLGLDLEHEIALVPAEQLRSEVVLLDKYAAVGEPEIFL